MKIRAILRLGLFVAAAWLGEATSALAQPAPAPSSSPAGLPVTADIGFDYIPGPASDVGLGKIVTSTSNAYGVHGNVQMALGPIIPHAAFDYRNWQSNIAGTTAAYQTSSIDGRFGIGAAFIPRAFIGVGYLSQSTPLGTMTGAGFGLDVIPRYDRWFSVYGSAWYYPWQSGTYTSGFPAGTAAPGPTLSQRIIKYRAGVTIFIPRTPIALDLGVAGDTGKEGNNVSPNTSEGGFFLGARAALK
jgi:hypothetical protein